MLIAHLSDPHLTAGALAAEPAAGLYRALGRVLALDPRPDCVVITGDLADHGQPMEYDQLREILGGYPIPVHVTTGNHDNAAAMVDTLGNSPLLGGTASAHYAVPYPGATIIALDSAVPGSPAGRLGPDQLAWLDTTLAAHPDVPALVCLHHPPIPVGIPYMDNIRLTDGPDPAAVITRHPHVVRVLTGHLHRAVTTTFATTLLTVAPSTHRAVDLRLNDETTVALVHEPPAFLLHLLTPQTSTTHTVPIAATSAPYGVY